MILENSRAEATGTVDEVRGAEYRPHWGRLRALRRDGANDPPKTQR